ncbi:MAG: MlaD family protein [Opitutales bacterium]
MNEPNPRLIGAFVAAALALLVGMLMFLGSSNFWGHNAQFILFFDQSVNGLNEGSAVKFRGVPVGTVQRILIRAEGQHPDSSAIPVIIKIDRTRLENDLGVMDKTFDPESIQDSIRRGLLAELSLESLITGQLFVEFSFDPERSPGLQWHLVGESDMMEIPTQGSSLDEITADLARFISDLGEIDLGQLNDNVNAVLVNMSTMLAGIESEEISTSVIRAADQVSALLSSESIHALQAALESIMASAESFNLSEGPLAETLRSWTAQLSGTLASLNRLSEQAGLLLEPDGSMRFQVENTLRELSRAAYSIRELADYLERNPSALLTGRSEGED